MSEIPPEIVEQIVDELDDDGESLVACLSVSRAFHSRARYHLFQAVQLETSSDFYQFISLCDISPVIPGLVQSLKIFPRINPVPHLPLLPNVTSLHIGGHLHDEWQTNFPSTACLTLQELVLPSAESFRSWICAYPCLTSLSVMAVVIDRFTPMGPYALAQGPPLEYLSLAYVSDIVYCVLLGSARADISRFALHGIRKIRHTTTFPGDAACIDEILAATRETLQELDMKVQIFDPLHQFHEVVDISQVPSVNYRVISVKARVTDSIGWLSCCTHAESDRPAHMERLAIHVDLLDWLEELDFFQSLEPLDAILSDPRYCLLKVVQFNLRGEERHLSGEKCQIIRDAILMALPKLQALGRLVVKEEII
ncbi:hypothetical protein IW261DRAFT_1566555 [Armillaria novae-zelandiae]|uniref:F-box domain-containing protein n=1 Tax=Armillaria novae-zelandiae TaxID=153914 RepID=A0AA39P418_9AGAR|nr:hypothetical protein IW261DRAFT_1566555 [Armillaria novae-zelandiae]